jgi:hypothetical protein
MGMQFPQYSDPTNMSCQVGAKYIAHFFDADAVDIFFQIFSVARCTSPYAAFMADASHSSPNSTEYGITRDRGMVIIAPTTCGLNLIPARSFQSLRRVRKMSKRKGEMSFTLENGLEFNDNAESPLLSERGENGSTNSPLKRPVGEPLVFPQICTPLIASASGQVGASTDFMEEKITLGSGTVVSEPPWIPVLVRSMGQVSANQVGSSPQ